MNSDQIKDAICNILTSPTNMALNIDVKDVSDSVSLINEFALDSIQILELIVNVEKVFKISIDTDNISLDIFDKFSDLIKYIQNQLTNGIAEKKMVVVKNQ